jgi:hypothetical protein
VADKGCLLCNLYVSNVVGASLLNDIAVLLKMYVAGSIAVIMSLLYCVTV